MDYFHQPDLPVQRRTLPDSIGRAASSRRFQPRSGQERGAQHHHPHPVSRPAPETARAVAILQQPNDKQQIDL